MNESPIFTRCYDLLAWLLPRTLGFPRSQRAVLARRLQEQAFCFQELLVDAALAAEPLARLQEADASLAKLRIYLRLAKDMQLLSVDQYGHAGRMTAELGRLLGGWLATARKNSGTGRTPSPVGSAG